MAGWIAGDGQADDQQYEMNGCWGLQNDNDREDSAGRILLYAIQRNIIKLISMYVCLYLSIVKEVEFLLYGMHLAVAAAGALATEYYEIFCLSTFNLPREDVFCRASMIF